MNTTPSPRQAAGHRQAPRAASGLRGVYAHENGRFRAIITYQRKAIHLGYHDSPELAASAYAQAALEYFGTQDAVPGSGVTASVS